MQYKARIKDLPEEMRPREKMLRGGEPSLSDAELLAVIIDSGTRDRSALDLAYDLLRRYKGLRMIKTASVEELTSEKGIGPARAIKIKAALELGRRAAQEFQARDIIGSPADVAALVMEEMRNYDREHFRVLYLDRKGGLLEMTDISVGGLHNSIVHPREVFKTAIKRSANAVIAVHNHPSGNPEPSREDIAVSLRLREAGELLGIRLEDHIVIGDKQYVSMKEKGLI
ncbi:MAG: DNA repair protein RadC [Syntrophomonadaceae bacterium]|nr:DNA repair protein RadC [Syntrophomonadaceae bacterium]